MLPNDIIDYIILKNLGESHEVLGNQQGCGEGQRGRPSQVGGPIQFEFESASPAGPFDAKKDAQDAYRLCFGRFTYAWKDIFITFPMEPV